MVSSALASGCAGRAKMAPDTRSIEHYLRMEQRRLFLASSYQFAERIARFTDKRSRSGSPSSGRS
jgi:hypothetical protein